MRINGVDVGAFIDAEMDRRDPRRPRLRNISDAAGLKSGWPLIEEMWQETVERASQLPDKSLNERVDGEFSFVETLRHLVFCTDAWVKRTVLADPDPYHPVAIMGIGQELSALGIDIDIATTFDHVLAAREDRMTVVRTVIEDLTDDEYNRRPGQNPAPGYPPVTSVRTVGECLGTIVNEEWWHHQYAIRDLAVIEARR